jgi:hypothetical protein
VCEDWQRLEQETVSGKNGNAIERLSELTGKPWGFVHSCAHELDPYSLDWKSLRRLLLSSLELIMTTGVDSVRICA